MLAEAAVLGLPVERFIRTGDPDELALLDAVRKEAIEVVDDLQTNLARKIVQERAKAEKRGKESS